MTTTDIIEGAVRVEPVEEGAIWRVKLATPKANMPSA